MVSLKNLFLKFFSPNFFLPCARFIKYLSTEIKNAAVNTKIWEAKILITQHFHVHLGNTGLTSHPQYILMVFTFLVSQSHPFCSHCFTWGTECQSDHYLTVLHVVIRYFLCPFSWKLNLFLHQNQCTTLAQPEIISGLTKTLTNQ